MTLPMNLRSLSHSLPQGGSERERERASESESERETDRERERERVYEERTAAYWLASLPPRAR